MRRIAPRSPHRSSVRGLTLLELMVGLTIGLVVSTAAVGTLVFMQTSSRLNGEVTRMQQDATLAFNLMGQYLRSSGSVSLTETADGGISLTPLTTFQGLPNSGGEVISATSPLELRTAINLFENGGTNGPQFDCLGNNVTGNSTLVTIFDINANQLRCGRGPSPSDSDAGSSPQPVVGNVAQFVVHYGVRNADNTLQYNAYSPSVPWTQVVSVRVCLMLTSNAPVAEFSDLFAAPSSIAFPDCNLADRSADIRADRLMRRVYRQVFTIRPAST